MIKVLTAALITAVLVAPSTDAETELNGRRMNGTELQGTSLNGRFVQAVSFNGMQMHVTTPQGSLMDTAVQSPDFGAVTFGRVFLPAEK